MVKKLCNSRVFINNTKFENKNNIMSTEIETGEIAEGEPVPESEIQNKLKGDAIGETMYTQRFVLKTLLKLKDIEWNEDLEDNLCFLWDSTVEKDVCDYLMEVDFPTIICNVILEYNTVEYGRLIEILVGILANILSAKCVKQLSSQQIDIVLSLIVSTDSLILIQLMRFIIAFSYNENFISLPENKSGEIIKLVKFILTSSNNFELIQKTLEALARVTENSNTELFYEVETVKIAIDACVRAVTEDGENDFELFSADQRNSVKFLLDFISNFCAHINRSDVESLSKHDTSIFSDIYIEFFTKLSQWYSFQENLLPITDELIFYFEVTNYVLLTMKISYNSDLFKYIFEILRILVENQCVKINEFIEMFCYFFTKGDINVIRSDLQSKESDAGKVCSFLEKQEFEEFSFKFEKDKLNQLLQ